MAKEVTHALISFCFEEFFFRLLTFSEARAMAFLFMSGLFEGGIVVDQSLL
jgi:hypothetical protein